MDSFFNDATYHLSGKTKAGLISAVTPDMEISFELKIENIDSCETDEYECVLWIDPWFYFGHRAPLRHLTSAPQVQ